mmetsp:Transcript_68855/g.155764  ORF Transcript_68855/g.155764 Transcript_68855/m.155764 type:complete len:238 (+) Transcript_68855:1236-1949(+)
MPAGAAVCAPRRPDPADLSAGGALELEEGPRGRPAALGRRDLVPRGGPAAVERVDPGRSKAWGRLGGHHGGLLLCGGADGPGDEVGDAAAEARLEPLRRGLGQAGVGDGGLAPRRLGTRQAALVSTYTPGQLGFEPGRGRSGPRRGRVEARAEGAGILVEQGEAPRIEAHQKGTEVSRARGHPRSGTARSAPAALPGRLFVGRRGRRERRQGCHRRRRRPQRIVDFVFRVLVLGEGP